MATSRRERTPFEPGRRIGPYELIRELGRGGMGVVWQARDAVLERDVAIKVMTHANDAAIHRENSARFLVEMKAAASINSTHVVQVLSLGTLDDGSAYLVMELVEGHTLLTVLNELRKLPPARAVHIARQIARGLQAAHDIGVLHRDLKPGNIMLTHVDGDDDVVKIVDFGLAKRVRGDEAITLEGAVLGTLPYMAPEQLRARTLDARADVFALGVLLYKMLAGRAPFEAKGLAEMITVQLSRRPHRIPLIPPALDAVVQRCLEHEREDRYASMAELDVALAGALADSPALLAPKEDETPLTTPALALEDKGPSRPLFAREPTPPSRAGQVPAPPLSALAAAGALLVAVVVGIVFAVIGPPHAPTTAAEPIAPPDVASPVVPSVATPAPEAPAADAQVPAPSAATAAEAVDAPVATSPTAPVAPARPRKTRPASNDEGDGFIRVRTQAPPAR